MFIDTSGIRVRNRISNTWRSWQIPRGGSSTWGGLSSSVKVPKRWKLDVTALPKNKISTVTTCTTYMQQLCRPIFFRWCASNWLDDPHCLDGIETTKRTSSPVNSDPGLEYSAPCPTCPLARSLDVHEKDKERLHQWIELMSLGLCLFDSFSFKWFVICDLFFGGGWGAGDENPRYFRKQWSWNVKHETFATFGSRLRRNSSRVQEERSTTRGLAKAQESGEVPWLMTSVVGVARM